jgi:hypothetical protein
MVGGIDALLQPVWRIWPSGGTGVAARGSDRGGGRCWGVRWAAPCAGGAGGWGHQRPVFHPSRVVYGSVPAGQARDRWFTLVNSGRAVTGRLTFKITGRGASGFTVRRNRCASVILPPGGSCSGLIRFAPGHAARYRARLTARAGKVTRDAILPLTGIGTGTATQVRSVSAGADYTCALKTDRSLWCWGDNSGGQLGDGTTADSPVPVQVPVSGQATDWATVSAGYNHTCAVAVVGGNRPDHARHPRRRGTGAGARRVPARASPGE